MTAYFDPELFGLFSSRLARLLACFAFFVGMLFAFAAVYYRLYKKKPGYFQFGEEILKAQKITTLKPWADLSEKVSAELNTIQRFLELINSGALEALKVDDEWSHEMEDEGILKGRRVDSEIPGIDVLRLSSFPFGGTGTEIYVTKLSDFSTWQQTLKREIIGREMQFLNANWQAALKSSRQDFWTYWDFLYFSTITQTTVGYGDILPNSTTIRKIAIAQILTGYAILIVVLNFLLA